MRTARASGLTPEKFFRLSARDRGLMEALTELEDHITATGYPDWITRDPDNMGWFRPRRRADFAAEALEREQKAVEAEPGMQWYVEYLRTPDEEAGEEA